MAQMTEHSRPINSEEPRVYRQFQDGCRPRACSEFPVPSAPDESRAENVPGKQKRQKAYIEEGGETFDFLREDVIMDASEKRPGMYGISW